MLVLRKTTKESIVIFIVLTVILAFWWIEKKDTERVYTIGVLRYITQTSKVEDGFYKGMDKLGYKDGKNVRYIVTPYGESPEKMQELAQILIDQGAELIVAITSVAASGAKKATEVSSKTNIPIVFTHSNQPDKQGHIKNFQSSGNNLTGVAINFEEVTEKKLEFFKKINPSIKKIGVLDTVYSDAAEKFILGALQSGAPKFEMEVVLYKVRNKVGPAATAELASIAGAIKAEEIDAFMYIAGPISNPPENVKIIAGMAKRLKIPAIYLVETQVELGGLMSYAHDQSAMGEQTAAIVYKVLNGRLPTNIPVEFPNKNSLIINLKTAKETGITIPPSLIYIADRVIE